jgi:hypothetical protein
LALGRCVPGRQAGAQSVRPFDALDGARGPKAHRGPAGLEGRVVKYKREGGGRWKGAGGEEA